VVSGPSTVQGSGNPGVEERDVAAFSGVELAGSNEVFVRVGGKQRVVVHADDNLLGHITTEVRAGLLLIGNTPESVETKSPTYVEIDAPSLDTLALSGSGIVSVTDVDATRLTMNLPGSGVLRVSGRAARLDVTLGGSGDAQLGQLASDDVTARVSGSGRIVVTATNSLDASVSGSGAIVYEGRPEHVTQSITGTGVVMRG